MNVGQFKLKGNYWVEAKKKKVKKPNVPVAELVYGALLHADVQKAVEKEFELYTYLKKSLKKHGDPIEQRYKEHAERDSVVDQLINYITCYKRPAASNDPKYEHIDTNEKQKISNQVHPDELMSSAYFSKRNDPRKINWRFVGEAYAATFRWE
ncbi:heat shock 70 kDa protein 15-like protein [Tanacetum coccineum]